VSNLSVFRTLRALDDAQGLYLFEFKYPPDLNSRDYLSDEYNRRTPNVRVKLSYFCPMTQDWNSGG